MIRLEKSRWIVGTPALEVCHEDLAAIEMYPLPRRGPFPLEARPYHAFLAVTAEQVDVMMREARALATLYGFGTDLEIAVEGASWLFADPAHPLFGTVVAANLWEDPDGRVLRLASGMIRVAPTQWTPIERVRSEDVAVWLSEKRTGDGRDPRLSSVPLGPNRPLFRDAVLKMKKATLPHRIYVGVAAVPEVLRGIATSGHEPPGCHQLWVVASGVAPKSGLAFEHLGLLTLLWVMATVDGLDVNNLESAEQVARRILMIERAVKKNPKNPDFSGLEHYMANSLDASGGVVAPDFDKHVASLQRDEALIMKNWRLAREEHEAELKRRNASATKGGKDGKGGKSEAQA